MKAKTLVVLVALNFYVLNLAHADDYSGMINTLQGLGSAWAPKVEPERSSCRTVYRRGFNGQVVATTDCSGSGQTGHCTTRQIPTLSGNYITQTDCN